MSVWKKSRGRAFRLNILRPLQDGRHFTDDIFEYVHFSEKFIVFRIKFHQREFQFQLH